MEIDLRRRLPAVVLCFTLAALGLFETAGHLRLTGPGWDAAAYWDAWRGAMYDGSVGNPGHYLYSPAFAHVLWPLAHTTWPLFVTIFIVINGVGLAWLLKPLPLTLAAPLWLAGSQEVMSGNIFIVIAIVAVVGMRIPHLWAFVVLTKITPGLGPVWFAARGEWSAVAKAAVTALLFASVSAAMAPGLWQDWFFFLVEQSRIADGAVGYSFIPGPVYRFPMALLLVVWAARTDRVWMLPVCMLLATPFIWNGSLTLLAAVPRLRAGATTGARPGRGGGPRARPLSSTSAATG